MIPLKCPILPQLRQHERDCLADLEPRRYLYRPDTSTTCSDLDPWLPEIGRLRRGWTSMPVTMLPNGEATPLNREAAPRKTIEAWGCEVVSSMSAVLCSWGNAGQSREAAHFSSGRHAWMCLSVKHPRPRIACSFIGSEQLVVSLLPVI